MIRDRFGDIPKMSIKLHSWARAAAAVSTIHVLNMLKAKAE